MTNAEFVEKFITRQETFYNRPLKPITRFVLREFAKAMEQGSLDIRQTIPEMAPLTGNKPQVAFVSEEIGSLTGGRYYAWFLACALMENGFEVTLYSNIRPVYYDAFRNFKVPNLVIIPNKNDLENLDVQADMYIGSPLKGNLAVTKLSKKYSKPGYCMIFDPAPLMTKYLGQSFAGWIDLIKRIKETNVNIISLCKSTSEPIGAWLNKREDQIFPIYPCINSTELDLLTPCERKDYVVFISRLVEHKKIEDVLDAVKTAGTKLKIISSSRGVDVEEMIAKKEMEKQVELCYRITDEDKFRLLYGARAVIVGAIFEGFGMWAAEAVATGTPLVCYDFYTIREIQQVSGVDNFYLAEYKKPIDLGKKLVQCLSEAKFGKRNHTFDFSAMVKRVGEVFMPEPRIGVVTIALNEDKFISASLKSVIKHPNIKKVAVVEGAVNLMSFASDSRGLSTDKTREKVIEVMNEENGNKIIYEQYGWAIDKSELRNRALTLLGKEIDYVLMVDADEVWKKEDLDNLVLAMKGNRRVGMLLFNFYHFWKKKNLRAIGGQWDSQMFRCFKYSDKSLHWGNHGAPVVNGNGKFINVTDGSYVVPNTFVYHYGYLKDTKRIQEKLEYYKKRDGAYLNVVDTFTDWQEGQPTQPTHGGGTVEEFKGEHPEEVKGII